MIVKMDLWLKCCDLSAGWSVTAPGAKWQADDVRPVPEETARGPVEAMAVMRILAALITAASVLWSVSQPARSEVTPAEQGGARPGDGNHFSPLDQLTPANASHLKLYAAFPTGSRGAHSGAPLVMGDMLVVLTPFPHVLYALDLRKAKPEVAWRYEPASRGMAAGLTCCGTGGPVSYGNHLYFNTVDGRTIALDPASGAVLWDVQAADPALGETLTGAPVIARGQVVLGNAGDDFGARGWITARSATTGAALWKHYSTGPDAEVGIGPGFAPPYPTDRAVDRGITTWPPSAWQHGGGGVSGPILWDASAGLLFHGTGHPAPWNPDQRNGDNRWTSGLFARDVTTGEARWFVPVNPHDLYALGSTSALLLVERDWRGGPAPLLIHPDGNGHVYVLDRRTGKVLSAEPFIPVNATKGFDLAAGALVRDPAKAIRSGATTRGICPARPGATGAGAAYSPRTGLLYIPVRRACMDMEARDTTFMPGTAFTGGNLRLSPAPGLSAGALVGWDIAAGHAVWEQAEPLPVEGGALATAGGLVFYGTTDGFFKALDAGNGVELWHFRGSSGIVGQPISYLGPDGRQYVAVLAGLGGVPGSASGREIDMRDATAANGQAQALRALPPRADGGGMLYIFALP